MQDESSADSPVIATCPAATIQRHQPDSAEAGAWQIGVSPDSSPMILCADCAKSSDRREQAEVKVKRANLACVEDPKDALLVIGGEPKSLMDCTAEDLEEGSAKMSRRAAEAKACAEWFAAVAERRNDEASR